MSEKKVKENPSTSSKKEQKLELDSSPGSREDIVGAAAIKPPNWDRKGWESIKLFLYDPEQGTVLGRTPLSWLGITIFYLAFYIGLLLFWFAMLGVFFQTLPPHSEGPRYTTGDSLIGENPGLYFFVISKLS